MLAQTPLAPWENFYVIVGSSAGALTGLQFVVIALIAETHVESTMREVRAFGSPTVMHFCTALLLSALCTAPWGSVGPVAVALGAIGLAGIVYHAQAVRHARRQTHYTPELSDWIWYAAVPIVLHALLVVAATRLAHDARHWLFVVAGSALAFLFVGIRNAWDTVTYIVIQRRKR